MSEFDNLFNQAKKTLERSMETVVLYYKTRVVLDKIEQLGELKERELAIASFQQWLDDNASQMFRTKNPTNWFSPTRPC